MTKKFIKEISRKNKLYEVEYDGVLYYQIAHTENGTAGTFEHDYALVKRIEEHIKLHGRALSKTKERMVFPTAKDGTPALALAAFLYHCYHGVPIEQVRSAKVQHVGLKYLPDGSEDCRKQSLVHMSGVQYKTDSREFCTVTLGEAEFVELRMNACVWPVLLDNDRRLIDLLADTDIFNNFHFNGTGVQAQFRETKDGVRDLPYVHQIACAVRKGVLTRENYAEWDNIFEQMTEGGRLQVDHLDTDRFNNTYQNLSVINSDVNDAKKGYTAADFGCYLTAWAYDWKSGDYLIEVATEGGTHPAYYRCSGDRRLLDFLDHLIGKKKMTRALRYCKFLGSNGEMVAVPLPNAAFAEEKCKYKANGGTGKHPKIEADTVNSVENGARLLAMNQSNPEQFVPWCATSGVSLGDARGIGDLLRDIWPTCKLAMEAGRKLN